MSALRRPAPPRPKALHVALTVRSTADVLCLAEKRREHAQTMIAALIDHLVASGRAEAMLAEMGPPPGHGYTCRSGYRLSRLQEEVLFILGSNREIGGVCRLSADRIACLAGRPTAVSVPGALRALEAKGLTAAHKRKAGWSLEWVLTGHGEDAWRRLAEGG